MVLALNKETKPIYGVKENNERYFCSFGRSCGIYQLHLYKVVRASSLLDTKQFGALENMEYPLMTITPRFTLTHSGSTY